MKNPFTVMKDKPKEFFRLIPQTGVTHLHCLEDPDHNAVWDMAVSPEGRVFFSACGESYLSLYARLYEYDHKTKKLIRHMELEKEILMSETSLRTSKFHTALSFIGNGRILTATHTTSPGPSHPMWMPYEYADHPYEGYPGSNLLIYNYKTGETRGLGILTPHDTAYGATYDPKNGDYFCITWMRGTGYVYNVYTGSRRCLGQISDSHTSRTFLLSDGHIYGSTYSGAMFRYNTDLREVEWLGVEAPGLIRHARELNGKLYFTTGPCSVPGRGQYLYSYDLKTRKIETVGRPVPKAEPLVEDPSVFYNAYGMAFDSKSRLWYGCMTFVPEHRYVGARLYMWDFLHGKEPVDCGFLGTPKRTLSITAEMHIAEDVLYISDGNHTGDKDTPCGILAIDLDKFVPALDTEERLYSHDYINYLPYQDEARQWYPKDDFELCLERYCKTYQNTVRRFAQFTRDNAFRHPFSHVSGVSVWQKVGFGNAAVRLFCWTGESTFSFWCGNGATFRVDCLVDEKGDAHIDAIEKQALPAFSACGEPVPEVILPAVAGRQYLAEASASVKMQDGSILVGTKDSMLAKISGEKIFSFGRVCTAGAIHALSLAPDGTVWGVAGHEEGVGQLFSFSDETGIRLFGLVPEAFAENGRNVSIYRPTALAVSPDGKYLAVGGADEISGAVVIKL